MASKGDSGGKEQDPRVARLRPDPSQPPQRTQRLSGLWGDSDRPGFARLYLTSVLDTYAEFQLEDVVATEPIPSDQPPFLGEEATRVELADEANVDFTRSRRVGDVDEFDLDVRFGRGQMADSVRSASSGDLACMKVGRPLTDPCDYTCDRWVCHTSLFDTCGCGGTDIKTILPGCRPGPGLTLGGNHCLPDTYTCPTDATCQGVTGCGTCHTDVGITYCGTCHTDAGSTQCGTCHTEAGHTACGWCDQGRRR